MKKKWIQNSLEEHGSLHKQLEIPESKKIPVALLDKILNANIGKTIVNPSKTGKRRIKVSRLLKKRANLAKNLKKISKKK